MFLAERVNHGPPPPPIFQECCCYWDDGGIGESPNGSMVTTPISPVRIYCACGRSAVSGGEGGDTYRDVDSCKSKNNRRKQRNEEKVARLREKKVTQCIICISLCFYIYFFFIWTLFQHTNKKKYKTIVGNMLIKGNQVYLFAVVKFSSKKYHIKAHLKIKGGGVIRTVKPGQVTVQVNGASQDFYHSSYQYINLLFLITIVGATVILFCKIFAH